MIQFTLDSFQCGPFEVTEEAQGEMKRVRPHPPVARRQPCALVEMGSERPTVDVRQIEGNERPDGRGHAPTLRTERQWAQPAKDDTEPTSMSGHLLGGLVMGGLAVVVGIGWIVGAIRRRSNRAQTAPTYAATGGVVYTAFQIGCAGLLILGGLAILGLMLAGGPS